MSCSVRDHGSIDFQSISPLECLDFRPSLDDDFSLELRFFRFLSAEDVLKLVLFSKCSAVTVLTYSYKSTLARA